MPGEVSERVFLKQNTLGTVSLPPGGGPKTMGTGTSVERQRKWDTIGADVLQPSTLKRFALAIRIAQDSVRRSSSGLGPIEASRWATLPRKLTESSPHENVFLRFAQCVR